MWVNREGAERPLPLESGVYTDPALSVDGNRLAVIRTTRGEPDVWVYDLQREGAPTRITRDAGLVANPLWTRDGSEVIYSRERRQYFELARRDWQAGAPEIAIPLAGTSLGGTDLYAQSVAPDGRLLVSTQGDSWDIWTAPLDGEGEPSQFRVTEFHELTPTLSRDGRWVAFQSNESGQQQIWIDPYPSNTDGRRRHRVTRGEGADPQWGPGGELFYRDGEKLMSVRIDNTTGTPGIPVELFSGPYFPGSNYAVAPDGREFLMIKLREDVASRREVVVVVNWFEELRSKTQNE